jgi:hypothetical protein
MTTLRTTIASNDRRVQQFTERRGDHASHEENEHERIGAEAEKLRQRTYASDNFRFVGTIILEPALRFRAAQPGFGGAEPRQQISEGLLMTT